MPSRTHERQPGQARARFVSYARDAKNVWELARAAATGEPVWWTVHDSAEQNDTVLFYCMRPLGSFIAHGRVLRRLEQRFRWRKPMAEVGLIRLLPRPVPIGEAKAKLGLSWLRAAQGFEQGPREGVDVIIAMGADR